MDKYPLKSLLDVRKLEESEQIRLLAEQAAQIEKTQSELDRLIQEKEDFDQLIAKEDQGFFEGLTKGIFQIEKIHAFEAYRDKLIESGHTLKKQLKTTEQKLCSLRSEREKLREIAEAALAKRKVVESHYEQWQSEQRREEDRLESKALDEISSDRFSRKKNSDTSI